MEKNKNKKIQKLEALIRVHNAHYWDEASPRISDEQYDKLVIELKALSPESPVLTDMGPKKYLNPLNVETAEEVVHKGRGLPKQSSHRHRAPMLSLDKCYDDAGLIAWLSHFRGDVVALPKFDGVACSLRYDLQGRLKIAATRGDGIEGEDITENAKLIADIPSTIAHPCSDTSFEGLEIRGEIYMKLSVFEAHKEKGKSNPRNLAAGAIKQKNSERSASYMLSFAAYDLLGLALETQMERLAQLNKFGFSSVECMLLSKEEAPNAYRIFSAQRPNLDYEIDGVVYKVNLVSEQQRLGATAHHPKYAIAYKFQGDSGVSTLLNVEWSVSRTGAITPVAVVSPILLSGVSVERASLHNLGYIKKLHITADSTLLLERRGGVIPHVEKVIAGGERELHIPDRCPSCSCQTVISGDFLYCSRPEFCPAANIGKLLHFASVLEMTGFGEMVIRQAYEKGIVKRFSEFYTLTIHSLALLEKPKVSSTGKKTYLGEVVAAKLVDEIEKKRKLPLSLFLRALGIDDLGTHAAGLLVSTYGSLERICSLTVDEIVELHGMGEATAKKIVNGLKRYESDIRELCNQIQFVPESDAESRNDSMLSGKTFLFTGSLNRYTRAEAEAQVKRKGGQVVSTVSPKLNYLVVGEEKSGKVSNKQKKAELLLKSELGQGSETNQLKILTENEFISLLGT